MTRQIQDKLIYEGTEYFLNEEILEIFFKEFPEKKPEADGFMTSLWRGYSAIYEIRENELFIKHISWFYPKAPFSPENFLKENFPNQKFTWYSGLLRIDDFRGEYDDENDEHAIYEILEFKKGDLVKHWKLNYAELVIFKDLLFEGFKTTADYRKLVQLWQNNNAHLVEEKIDGYIYERIIQNVREV